MKGKKIVFFSTPVYSHLISVFPIIEKLVKDGNQVDWYCSRMYKKLIDRSGAVFVEYNGDFDNKYEVNNIISNFYSLFYNLLMINRISYDSYLEVIKNSKVDLILYDSMCSFAKNISIQHNIKHICLCTTFAYNIYTFIFSNMFISTIKLFIKNFKSIIDIIADENKYRQKKGIKILDIMDLFINKGDKTIVFTPKEIQPFSNTFDKSFNFVGTTIENRISMIDSLCRNYDNVDIYMSLGSILYFDKKMIDKLLNTSFVGNKKILISAKNISDKVVYKNIVFSTFVNQIEMLKKCKIFINCGGLNSIYESIYYRRPQICIPMQEEQMMNAKIVEKLGVGIVINKIDDLKNIRYENIIESMNESLDKYSNLLRNYDGTSKAIKVIDELINS